MERRMVRKLESVVCMAILLLGLLPAAPALGAEPIQPVVSSGQATVSDLRVVRLENGSLVVKWRTARPTTGWVVYGIEGRDLDHTAYDAQGESAQTTTHWVLLEGLAAEALPYYAVVVDGVIYDDRGRPFAPSAALEEGGTGSETGWYVLPTPEPGRDVTLTAPVGPEAEDAPEASSEAVAPPAFTVPSPGLVGWLHLQSSNHKGIDIWTGDPNSPSTASEYNPAPPGSTVYAAYAGTVKAIYKSSTNDGYNWVNAPRNDPAASIVILEHHNVLGYSTLYSRYLHMARDDGSGRGAGTYINSSVWDYLASGQGIPAGFALGRQGDLRLGGSRITHLHFSVGITIGESTSFDPSGFLGFNVRYGASGSFRWGDGMIASGQSLRGMINANERDWVYFYARSGAAATIRMNKRTTAIDPYIYLYAPDGSLVSYNDDGGGSLNSLIDNVVLSQEGIYKIVCRSYSSSQQGGYDLSLTLGSGGGNSQPPAAPTNIRATAISSSQIRVEWNDNSNNESGFRLYDGGVTVATPGANTTSYTVGGLAPGTYRCYAVQAYNSKGSSAWAYWGCATTPQSGGGSNGNLAAGRSSWATSQESSSHAPRFGNDGNTGTRWSSQISSSLGWQWYKIDLGSAQTFSRFVVRWEAAYGARYYLAFCDDNCTSNDSRWYGWERRLGSQQVDVLETGRMRHRYVGILMCDRAPRMNNFSFWEFEVYNLSGSSRPELSAASEPQALPIEIMTLPEPELEQ